MKNKTHWRSSIIASVVLLLSFMPSTKAAEEIVFFTGAFSRSISIKDLEKRY